MGVPYLIQLKEAVLKKILRFRKLRKSTAGLSLWYGHRRCVSHAEKKDPRGCQPVCDDFKLKRTASPQKSGGRVKSILNYYSTMLLHTDGNSAIALFPMVKSNVM